MDSKELTITALPSLPIFADILREIKQTPYGDISLTINSHNSSPVGMVISSFRHEKFSPGENSKAMERTIAIAKKMVDDKETGTLSYTIVFNNGEIRELIHQFHDKITYDLQNSSPVL